MEERRTTNLALHPSSQYYLPKIEYSFLKKSSCIFYIVKFINFKYTV